MTAQTLTSPICALAELPDGMSRGFDPLGEGKDTMFIVRRGAAIFGWRNACPHYDHARMAWKKDEFLNSARDRIVCGAHGAEFEIERGACTLGPCLGQRLTSVPLRIENGAVYIDGPFAPGLRKRTGHG